MQIPDIQIETERLLLRLPQRDDFDAYAEMMGDDETARYIGGHMVRAAAWRKFLQMPGAWAMQGFAMFTIVEKTRGEWIGQAGPWQPEGWPGTEVGWSIRRSAWGKGYAREAAIAAIDWTFDNLGWTEVIHSIQAPNAASIVLAERLGSVFRRSCRLPPPFDDTEVGIWAQTRETWTSGRTLREAVA